MASTAWRETGGSIDRAKVALDALGRGEMAVLVRTEDPDSIGTVVLGAQHATPGRLHALSSLAAGWSYLALTDERCDALGLRVVATDDDLGQRAPITVAIRARDASASGIGVSDRARTIAVAIDPSMGREAVCYGGHVQPVCGSSGGVLESPRLTEAALDLARLSGLTAAAVLGEILNEDGSATRGAQLVEFAARHGLPVVTIADLIAYRMGTERLVERIATATIATSFGTYLAVGYRGFLDDEEHIALVRGDVDRQDGVLVYFHLACWEGDVFRSQACECRARLDAAQATVRSHGRGVIVHLAHQDYHRHRRRDDSHYFSAFALGAQILVDLGLTAIRVLTDDALELPVLMDQGLTVISREPLLGSTFDRVARLGAARSSRADF